MSWRGEVGYLVTIWTAVAILSGIQVALWLTQGRLWFVLAVGVLEVGIGLAATAHIVRTH